MVSDGERYDEEHEGADELPRTRDHVTAVPLSRRAAERCDRDAIGDAQRSAIETALATTREAAWRVLALLHVTQRVLHRQ